MESHSIRIRKKEKKMTKSRIMINIVRKMQFSLHKLRWQSKQNQSIMAGLASKSRRVRITTYLTSKASKRTKKKAMTSTQAKV